MIRGWFFIFLFLVMFIDIYLSAAVYVDAKKLKKPALDVPPPIWGLLSFLFPFLGFFIYWLMNRSGLANVKTNPSSTNINPDNYVK